MSELTKGKWIVKELLTTWGVFAMNEGKREPVARCFKEANARLIAAAPEMYELLKVWTNIQAQPTLMNARKKAQELLERIDRKEAHNG